jgi:RHS repeat-associated protein
MANINIATGEVCYAAVDFSWDGCPAFEFRRTWRSGSKRTGPLAHGWTHPLDLSLTVADENELVFRDEEGSETRFSALSHVGEQTGDWDPARPRSLRWTGEHLELTVAADRILVFGPDPAASGQFHLLRIVTPQGSGLDLTYDGRLLRHLRDVFGRQLLFDYDGNERISVIYLLLDNGDRLPVARYQYDFAGDLRSATDALGNTCSYEYASHLMIREVNRIGGACHMEYDRNRRCICLWKSGGVGLRRLEYDTARRRTLVTNSRGFSTVYRLDENSHIIAEVNALGEVKNVVYDGRQQYLTTLHESGAPETVMRVVDPEKHEVTEIAPSGAATIVAYNGNYQPIRYTDAGGATWTAEYDARGNRSKRTTPSGAIWRWEYDDAGFPLRILHPNGRDVHITRSADRQSGTIEDNFGRICSYSFGIWGKLDRITKAGGETMLYTYDSLGHLASIRQPDGSTAYYRHDPLGNITEYIDENGFPRRFGYDLYGVIISRTDALGQIVRFEYDTEHNLTSIVNQKGERCTFEYDALNRQIQQTNFDGRIARYEYSPDGSVTRTWDPVLGSSVDIVNNADGKLVAAKVGEEPIASSQYDALTRPLSAEAKSRTPVRWAVDPEGRLTKESSGSYSQKFAYDAAGNRISLADTDGREIRYEFDVRSRLSAIDGPGGRHDFTYDDLDRLVSHTMPNACVERNSYDVCNQLVAKSVRAPDGLEIHSRRYEYDPAGRVRRIWGRRDLLWDYKYDALGRLTLASGVAGVFQYSFDPTDNWAESPILGPMRYEGGNRLAQAGTIVFLHDMGGSLIARLDGDDGETYEYDGPVLVRTNRSEAPPIEFFYDALNRRTEKRIGANTVRYRWDNYTILGEQSGAERVTYLFPPKGLSPVEMIRGSESFCYVNDHLGAAELLLDLDGKIAWRSTRSPWAEVENREGAVENPLGLPGQYRDENGLCYSVFRYYDPATGRYMTQDPIGLVGGLNSYVYPVDPVNQIDPQGLIKINIPVGKYDKRYPGPVKCKPTPAKPSGCDDPDDPANDDAPDAKGCYKADGKTLRGGGGPDHNKDIKKIADKNSGKDKRINQQQVDAAGDRVGRNRPDIQVTIGKERHYIEVDTDSSRGPCHMYQICKNDEAGIVHLIRI